MKKDLKKLRQSLADKKKAGLAKNTELNALLGKDALTDAENTRLAVLEPEVAALENEVLAISAEIDAEEKKLARDKLFMPGMTAARTMNETDPVRTLGFKGLGEFALAVRSASMGGTVDQRLYAAASDTMQNAGPSGEGWEVPPQYRDTVWELAFAPVDLLGLVDSEPTSSNSVMVPKDETTPWGATGVQAAWRVESGAMNVSKAALTGDLLPLHELYAFVVASSELLEDAPRLESRLTRKAAAAIRWKASDAIMWGSGAGMPLGFMNSKAVISIDKEANQAARTINAANIYNMLARLWMTGDASPLWLANSIILPQLANIVIGQQPVWTPVGTGLQDGPADRLLGKPLLFTEHCQDLGTAGDLVLVDAMGYYGARKAAQDLNYATSMHLYFDQNLQAFRWTFRYGGQPYLSKPVAMPRPSTLTKSHFITLADRK